MDFGMAIVDCHRSRILRRSADAGFQARGERVGGIPYGYRLAADGKHVEEDPGERATVGRVQDLRAQGLSLRGIGRALLAEGRRPRSAKGWHVQVLARIVRS